jgi:hypothetical protein
MVVAMGTTKMVTNGDMSASITSDTINLVNKEGFSIHAIYTGSPVGTLNVSGSIDGVTFTSIPDSLLSISAAGDVLYNFREVNYVFARVVWTFTSGTGTLNIFFSTKDDE